MLYSNLELVLSLYLLLAGRLHLWVALVDASVVNCCLHLWRVCWKICCSRAYGRSDIACCYINGCKNCHVMPNGVVAASCSFEGPDQGKFLHLVVFQ